jgi:hypothetical protein
LVDVDDTARRKLTGVDAGDDRRERVSDDDRLVKSGLLDSSMHAVGDAVDVIGRPLR